MKRISFILLTITVVIVLTLFLYPAVTETENIIASSEFEIIEIIDYYEEPYVYIWWNAKTNINEGSIITIYSQVFGILDTENIRYQWQICKEREHWIESAWHNIEGANESTYTFTASTETINARYRLIVTYN